MDNISKKWVREFKIAIINSDIQTLQDLYKDIPNFQSSSSTLEELQEVEALMANAIEILNSSRESLGKDLTKVKVSLAYQKNMR